MDNCKTALGPNLFRNNIYIGGALNESPASRGKKNDWLLQKTNRTGKRGLKFIDLWSLTAQMQPAISVTKVLKPVT
jgi:hypothetical protein